VIAEALKLDAEVETAKITGAVRDQVLRKLRRRGVVLGLSGGIDSSVVAALCAKSLGAERVLGILMPEDESDPDSLRLGKLIAESLGIETVLEDIGPMLEAAGCYRRREEYIRRIFPEYGLGYKCKLILENHGQDNGYNLTSLVIQSPDGAQRKARAPLEAYLGIVAASNMKQRMRKGLEYFHADRLNYAVAGTPNRLEYDQGFFVKNGDGAADLKPIAHLYKCQVYQMAEHLGIPEEIRLRTPTTDTYSLPQTQEEFYFALPYQQLDACLFAMNRNQPLDVVAGELDLSTQSVERIFHDIRAKRRATAYQHQSPLLVEPVVEVSK
jgi:NAD+ synthase